MNPLNKTPKNRLVMRIGARTTSAVLVTTLVTLLLIGGGMFASDGRNGLSWSSYLQVPPPLPTPTIDGPFMDQATVDRNMALKWQAIADEEAEYQASKNGPYGSTNPADYPPIQDYPTPVPELGVLDYSGPEEPGWGALFDLNNSWLRPVNGDATWVMAGSRVEQVNGVQVVPEQGLVIVRTAPSDRTRPIHVQYYDTPYRCGPLRVVAEGPTTIGGRLIIGGHILLVSTTMPSWFEFDVNDHTWYEFGVEYQPSLYMPADPPCPLAPPVPTAPPLPPPPPVPTVESTVTGVLTPDPCNPRCP
jgi:hypothetical protein